MGRRASSAAVGFAVGIIGGLIGLGGAELRLPYLVGVLGLTAHAAVPVNLAVSMFTILAAVPARLAATPGAALAPFLGEAAAVAAGAVAAAYLGAGWLRRLPGPALARLIFWLLTALGVALLAEAAVPLAPGGLLPDGAAARLAAGPLFGALIGSVSSVLGVAGGEVIIPTLVFGYGVPVVAAGSLGMMVSLPTVAVGIARHAAAGAYADRGRLAGVVLPMGLGSVGGAVAGGLLAGAVPAGLVKAGLGVLLIWSAWKVFAHHGRSRGAAEQAGQSS